MIDITACKYEQRDGRSFAVAPDTNDWLWEYELFGADDGEEFCREILKRGTIRSELWRRVVG